MSRAQVFARGTHPVVGRFNLGTRNPNATDRTERVRGLGIRIATPDGQEWRSAMMDLPFFPVATPQAFYPLLVASGSKEPAPDRHVHWSSRTDWYGHGDALRVEE